MKIAIIFFLFAFGTQSISAKEVEKCFIYPVNDTNSSPWFQVKGNSTYQVTINTISKEGNVLKFIDENKDYIYFLNLTDYLKFGYPSDKFDKRDVDIFFQRRNDSMAIYIKGFSTRNITIPKNPRKLKIKSQQQVYATFDCPTGCKKFETAVIHTNLTTNPFSVRIYGKINDLSNYVANIGIKYKSFTIDIRPEKLFNLKLNETFGTNWFLFDISLHSIFREHYRCTYRSPNWYYHSYISVTSPTHYTKTPSHNNVTEFHTSSSSSTLVLNFSSTTEMKWGYNCKPEESTTVKTRDRGDAPSGSLIVATSLLALLLLVTVFGIVVFMIRGCLKFPPCPAMETGRQNNQEENEYAYMDMYVFRRQMERERLERENNQQNPQVMAQEAGEVGNGSSNHSSINSIYEGLQGDAGSGNSEGCDQESIGHVSINSLYERFVGANNVTDASNQEKISVSSLDGADDVASNIAGASTSERIDNEITSDGDDFSGASNVSDDGNH